MMNVNKFVCLCTYSFYTNIKTLDLLYNFYSMLVYVFILFLKQCLLVNAKAVNIKITILCVCVYIIFILSQKIFFHKEFYLFIEGVYVYVYTIFVATIFQVCLQGIQYVNINVYMDQNLKLTSVEFFLNFLKFAKKLSCAI